jgi:hypothetical protein
MSQEAVLYRETVPISSYIVVPLTLVLALIVVLQPFILSSAGAEAGSTVSLILIAVFVFLGFIVWNFRAIRILVTQEAIEVTYGLFNHQVIPATDVASCEETKATWGRYWGVGVRYGNDKSIAYTTNFGPAVQISRRHGRLFVVSTKRPAELCAAIRSMGRF